MNTEAILHDFAAFRSNSGRGDESHHELMTDINNYLQCRGHDNMINDQAQFMRACGQTTGILNSDQIDLYAKLICEELGEFVDASNPIESIDAAVDTIVVCLGYLHSLGIDVQAAWNAVHKTNMAKVTPLRLREDGKILKPDGWIGPESELKRIWESRNA